MRWKKGKNVISSPSSIVYWNQKASIAFNFARHFLDEGALQAEPLSVPVLQKYFKNKVSNDGVAVGRTSKQEKVIAQWATSTWLS